MVAEDIYAVNNLLPAGVIQLFFNSTFSAKLPTTESDNWNALTPFLAAHNLQIATSSLPRLHDLDFLVLHRYVRATWRVSEDACGHVHVRVYLIPFDLPGAHGMLVAHNRDRQKVMLYARKALNSLLRVINRSTGAWSNDVEPCDSFEPFLIQQHVSCFRVDRIGLT